MSGVRGELNSDRSKKSVTRTGTEKVSAFINNWKYGVEITFSSDSSFEIFVIDQITHERFTVIRADGSMMDWIMHNFEPDDSSMIEPYDFDEFGNYEGDY